MSQENFLKESDIDTLINLLLRSQQSRTREALCFSIGIDPKRLSFLRNSSDSDFFLLLIEHLNEIGDQEALCKLCCKELVPIFHKGTYSDFLSALVGKLNCNQELRQNDPNNNTEEKLTSPESITNHEFGVNVSNQSETSKPQSWLEKFSSVKYKLFAAGVVLLTGFTGLYFYERSHSSVPRSQTLEVHADDSKGTPWMNKENRYVNVSFEATGNWLAIPDNTSGIPDNVKGYISPNGAPNFPSNTTVCARFPLGALVVRGEDKQCKAAYGTNGSFELKPGETVYFMMNDIPRGYGDNKGQITVKLSVDRKVLGSPKNRS